MVVVAAASSSSNTLVGIIAGVASGVIVALISAYIQSKNTTRTIDAEKAGLTATIDAEKAGLTATLDAQKAGLTATLDAQRAGLTATLDAEKASRDATIGAQKAVLKETLEAEQDRLDTTLKAERARLETQLSFQRGETDRAELRGLLDQLAAHLSALWILSGRVDGIIERGVDDEDKDEFEALQPRLISEVADNLSTARTAAMNNIDQLKLRLGDEGQGLVGAATVVWFHAGFICEKAVHSEPSPEILARIRKDRKMIEEKRKTFNTRAFEFTQARLHRPD